MALSDRMGGSAVGPILSDKDIVQNTAFRPNEGHASTGGRLPDWGFAGATYRFVPASPKAEECPQWMLAPKSEEQAISKWGDVSWSKIAAGSKQGGGLCPHRTSNQGGLSALP